MAKVKQLTVWIESRPGELGRIGKALGDAKVNITGFVCYGGTAESPIRLQVASPSRAKKALEGLGVRVSEEDILRLTLPDKPGILGEVGRRLGQANINVEYAFGTVAKGGRKADVALMVSDLAGAIKALRGL